VSDSLRLSLRLRLSIDLIESISGLSWPNFLHIKAHSQGHSRYFLDSQFYHFDCTQFDSTQTKRAISAICLTSCCIKKSLVGGSILIVPPALCILAFSIQNSPHIMKPYCATRSTAETQLSFVSLGCCRLLLLLSKLLGLWTESENHITTTPTTQ